MIEVRVTDNASAELRALAAATPAAVDRGVARAGALLLTRVRVNASTGHHRPGAPHIPGTGPGPNVATGDYRRSITLATARTRGGAQAEVFTNSAQGWRLERGFTGTDALGRTYRQAPFPHFEPAADYIEPLLPDMLATAVTDLAGGSRA